MKLRKVQPGDPLQIPADTWNAMIDTAAWHRSGPGRAERARSAQQRNTGVVWVQNKSGSDFSQYDLVEIDKPIALPASNEKSFRQRIGLQVVKATAAKRAWAILTEPIKSDKIGQAVIDGVCICKINLTNKSDLRCDSDTGQTKPKSGAGGPAQILWVLGGAGTATATGEQWAVLRLGAQQPVCFPIDLTQTGGTDGTDSTAASWTYSIKMPGQTEAVGTVRTPLWPPRSMTGSRAAATQGIGYIDTSGAVQIAIAFEGLSGGGGSIPLGTAAYQVYQMTSGSAAAWDLLRLGP